MDAALDAMDAAELREVVRQALPRLEHRLRARIVDDVVERAARSGSKWRPKGPGSRGIAAIVRFAEKAKRDGHADASVVNGHLREGVNAFLERDYAAAVEIFRALLLPVTEGEIDLGQDEQVEEVLGVDVAECAARYVAATYLTSARATRAIAVLEAIRGVESVVPFWIPLRDLERVALEPLPQFEDFLLQWRTLLEAEARTTGSGMWEPEEHRWLREVVERLEGTGGLAGLARSTRREQDFRAWCGALAGANEWEGALAAFIEAAEAVGEGYRRGKFMDGAALAAQELGRKDLPARLEAAWRAAPSMPRLRRWLGSARRKADLRKRAGLALDACPERALRQRALLHLVLDEYEMSSGLLVSAEGLGWSDAEHPGHLLFPLFCVLLGGESGDVPTGGHSLSDGGMDIDEFGWWSGNRGGPRLATPEVAEIVRTAGIAGPKSIAARNAMCAALRKAAEKRVAGVTERKRRGHYAHAAALVAACARIDATGEGERWVARIRTMYSRYPALRRELDRRSRS